MNIFSVTGLIISVASIVLAFYTFVNVQKKKHVIWGFFTLCIAIWGLGIFKFTTVSNTQSAILWWKIAESGVILIPTLLIHFILEFLGKSKKILIPFYGLSIFFLFSNLVTNTFFGKLHFVFNEFYYISSTKTYSFFVLVFMGSAIYSVFVLLKESEKSHGLVKRQTKYLAIAFVVGFLGGGTSFLPVYNINVYPVFNILICVSVLIVVYSMFKHNLLDIKIISTQLLIFSIWFFLLGRILLADNWKEKIIDGVLLIFVVSFGILLIRSVVNEIKNREKMEELAIQLKQANTELKRLDKAKSEFLSIASHQLRTPLTAIKGYSSMILESQFGELSKELRGIVDKVFQSSERLVAMVDDFLNISRIEAGTMKYDFFKFDIKEMINDTINDLVANSKKAQGLKIEFDTDGDNFKVTADKNKITQVISNLFDNALKYTPSGFIKIFLSENPETNSVLIKVKDSGVGISSEMLSRLFKKFTRASEISRLHTDGSGLGLYVAKKIVEDHNGKIWAESEGKGKGSTFFVELPIS